MRLGSDVLLASTRLRGMRVGVVANPASIDQDFTHIVDRVAKTEGVTLGAIFGPQHGFNADLQDNMIETAHTEDRGRRVPIYSLYSETREPTAGMLAGLDALVIDMQDIGARIYTFVYTMANCLRAAARHGVKVFVCDRPNPIGGTEVEGALLCSGRAREKTNQAASTRLSSGRPSGSWRPGTWGPSRPSASFPHPSGGCAPCAPCGWPP